MKYFLLGFLAAALSLPIGTALAFRSGMFDVNADAAPSKLESRFMAAAVRNSIAKQAAMDLTPTGIVDEDRMVEGGKLYEEGCVGCHGELGKPLAPDHSDFPPAPQLPHIGTEYTEPQIYWIVKHGIRMTPMSAYGPFYSESKLRSIAAFVHQIRNLPSEVQQRILHQVNQTRP
jgi:mono/diheme cytochrome c family protein